MLFTGCKKTHVMFTQRSGEVDGCTSSTCCYCSRLNEHRKEKFVLLALLLSAQNIKDCTRGSIHLPSLSGFNVTACASFTQGCETEKQKWMNPSVLGSKFPKPQPFGPQAGTIEPGAPQGPLGAPHHCHTCSTCKERRFHPINLEKRCPAEL